MAGYTVIQKDRTRYTFIASQYSGGNPRYSIHTEQCLIGGGCLSMRDTTKEEGNRFYTEMIAKGFKQFRNAREVSWYATVENNTPYEEEWKIEGKYLVPIKSQVLSIF